MRKIIDLATGVALLAGMAAGPVLAQGIYASANDGVDTNFFFKVAPSGAGGMASNFGLVLLEQGPDTDDLPFTAMTAVNGQLKGSSVSAGGSFDYFFDVTPRLPSGGSTSDNGQITEFDGGVPLSEPLNEMAAHGGVLWGTSWSGSFNYFFEITENAGPGAFGDNFGALTLGEGGRFFGYALSAMAEFDGQLYGAAYDGTQSLFFRINPNTDGTAGAWIDGLGVLEVGGGPDTDPVDAMVGTPDGLFATSWNSANSYNYLFRITPDAGGFGGQETDVGELTLDGARIPFRINALGYLASVPGGVPEPATWAMMLLGFGAVGMTMRWRSRAQWVAA